MDREGVPQEGPGTTVERRGVQEDTGEDLGKRQSTLINPQVSEEELGDLLPDSLAAQFITLTESRQLPLKELIP